MSIKATIFSVFIAFLLGMAVIVGGLYFLDRFKLPSNYVQLSIYNQSSVVIKELAVTYSAGKSTYTQQLPPHENAFFAFPQQSEGSYSIVAITTNNDTLIYSDYIEAGYVVDNTILDGRIIYGTDLSAVKPK